MRTLSHYSVLAVMILALAGCGEDDQQQGEMAMPVEAAAVESGVLRQSARAVGTLVAEEGVVVRPEVAGRIEEIGFTEGQKVEAGALLLRLENAIERANLALAEQNYRRAKSLAGRGAGTEQSFDEAEAELAVAKARLDKTRITAPFAGTVGIRRVSLGDYVSPGQDLVTLQALETLKVDFRLPERALPQLAVGQTLQLTTGAYPGEVFAGTVRAVDPLVDEASRSVGVRAVVPNAEGKLRPGLFAEVELWMGEVPGTLFVPPAALVPMGEQKFVFAINAENRAAMLPVEILERQSGRVAVRGELKAGQMVVTGGQAKLMMGPPGSPPALVQMTNAPAGTAEPAHEAQ